MTLSVADLERWDAGSVRAVAEAATKRAGETRAVAHDIGGIMGRLVWEGESFESAMAKARTISTELEKHADECDQAAKAVSAAASEVESIKAEWSRIQHMADRWSITIDVADGALHYPTPADPHERAEVEHHAQIVHDAIVDLLRRADSTDQHLSAAVNGAISDMADALGTDHIDSPQDAQQTVERALAGNHESAAQVRAVLDSINGNQRAGRAPVTPVQASVLSQLQAQQHGMSIEALNEAEQRLGDSKGIIADSWQLMSNPDIHFPTTQLTPGAVDDPKDMAAGGFGQLPASVQSVLSSKGMSNLNEMTKLTNIVKDGNPILRQGTALDRNMLNKATEIMDAPTFDGTSISGRVGPTAIANDGRPVALDVLATAGQDHLAIHDVVRDSAYADRFMKGVTSTDWSDGGNAAGAMFGWTGDAVNGPDARLAAETASAYGSYVGHHEQELLHMGGNQTLGQMNPELVRGLSHGLTPYIPDIAELSQGRHAGFATPDTAGDAQSGSMPIAKGIFSVLSTDRQASDYFNGQAGRDAVDAQRDYANDFKHGVDMSSDNRRLRDSMTLQGLVDSGIHSATDASGINDDAKTATAYAAKKSAYDFAFAGLDAAGVPGTDLASKAFEQALIGEQPTAKWDPHAVPDLDLGQGEQQVLNALAQSGVPIHRLPEEFLSAPDPSNPDTPRHILSFEEYNSLQRDRVLSSSQYNDAIKAAMNATMGESIVSGIDDQLTSRFNAVTEDVDPQK
ncbi:TPR repeat region-containing protein [Mycolicibacterium sp. CBM1]